MPIDSTVSGAAANSYASVSEFQSYWAARLIPSGQAAPSSFTSSDVALALMQSCVRLEQEQYLGRKSTSTQALKFPRVDSNYIGPAYNYAYGLVDDDDFPIDSTTIPQAVKDAQCELAYSLLLDSGMTDLGSLAGFTRIGLGNGEIDVTLQQGVTGDELPVNVSRLLRNFLTGAQAQVFRA